MIDVEGVISDIAELKGLVDEEAVALPTRTQLAIELGFKLGEAIAVALITIANKMESESE